MSQIRITRLKEWANRRFAYKIVVNGKAEFEIANGEEKTMTVDNVRTLQAKLMWCGSERIIIADDADKIKEVRVKANKGPNVWFPFVLLAILMICNLVNIFYPDNGAKEFMTGIMIGVIIFALSLVTIWRNKFLDIKLVTD